jgi:hypothetical protein
MWNGVAFKHQTQSDIYEILVRDATDPGKYWR